MVGTTNTDIVSVRSVGSNPANPSSESKAYISDVLNSIPTNTPGLLNGVPKGADKNYLADYDRMRELGVNVAENNAKYWLGSRMLKEEQNILVHFYIRNVSENGILEELKELWIVGRSSAMWQSDLHYGVRPVISLKSNVITKYLDE